MQHSRRGPASQGVRPRRNVPVRPRLGIDVRIDIWSDVVCPWCYIGKRRFERALADFPHAGDVDRVWPSFELDPNAERSTDVPPAERLAAKYGLTVEQAEQANERLTGTAAEEGLEFHLDEARSGNSFAP